LILMLTGCRVDKENNTDLLLGTAALLYSFNSSPAIYITIVSHNETDSRYDYYNTESGYLQMRNAIISMAQLFSRYGAQYHFQPDWRFLEAAKLYETPANMANTNNKNILRYLKEDLGHHVDPHSHESGGYNYADVAYLISQFGVDPGDIVGGFIQSSSDPSQIIWEKFRNPVYPLKYSSSGYSWGAHVLWGGGTMFHLGEDYRSGLIRPSSADNFFTHNPSGNLIALGNCSINSNLNIALDNLVLAIYNYKIASSNRIYNISMVVFEQEVVVGGPEVLKKYEDNLKKIDAYVKQGKVQWASLNKTVTDWQAGGEIPALLPCN